jgi:hypothetical protein
VNRGILCGIGLEQLAEGILVPLGGSAPNSAQRITAPSLSPIDGAPLVMSSAAPGKIALGGNRVASQSFIAGASSLNGGTINGQGWPISDPNASTWAAPSARFCSNADFSIAVPDFELWVMNDRINATGTETAQFNGFMITPEWTMSDGHATQIIIGAICALPVYKGTNQNYSVITAQFNGASIQCKITEYIGVQSNTFLSNASANITTAIGFDCTSGVVAGALGTAYGARLRTYSGLTQFYGVRIESAGGAHPVNVTGIYIGAFSGAGTNWSIYSAGSAMPAAFAGKVAIGGTTAPLVALDLEGTGDNGSIRFAPNASDPSVSAVSNDARVYLKNNRLVFAINVAGTMHYFYLDGTTTANQSLIYSASQP